MDPARDLEENMTELNPGEMLCPKCNSVAHAEMVDIGVGLQQVTPFHCDDCGWTETDTGELIDR